METPSCNGKPKTIVAHYDYRDESGQLLYQCVRYEPKDFRQRQPNDHGGWTWNLRGVRLVPYRLPELLAHPEKAVFIPEGEKDCDNLAAIDVIATTNPMGQGKGKWKEEFSKLLSGRDVCILPDNDDVGQEHAQFIAESLHGIAATVKVLELPGLPTKGDVSNWLTAGGTKQKLLKLAIAAPSWHGGSRTEETNGRLDNVQSPKSASASRLSEITVSASELLALKLPEPTQIIPSLLTEGLGILAGKPKIGKSWLALHWALAISLGGTVFGQIKVDQGAVLYLALEDGKRRLVGRLKKLFDPMNIPAPAELTFSVDFPRLDKGGLSLLERWLEQTRGKAKMIVIDTLAKVRPFRPKGNGYSHDYEDAGNLKGLADRFNVAILALGHVTKLPHSDFLDEVSGTLGLTGAADTICVLKRTRGNCDAEFLATGRDIEEQEFALRWDPEWALWTILGDADSYRLSRERKNVIEELTRAKSPQTPTQVAQMLGKEFSAAKKLLWTMARAGQIQSVEGAYTVKPQKTGNPGNLVTHDPNGNRG